MLHNKGNTILIMARTLVATPLVSLKSMYFDTMTSHSIFLAFKINNTKHLPKIYYLFTTSESENIRNYKKICGHLSKIKM